MADPIEIGIQVLLTVGGWIVATIVTVWSVGAAHRREVETRQKREDELAVYQPLYQELQGIVENRERLPFGVWLWVPSDAFKMIKMRLLAERHRSLREAVEELERRYAIHGASAKAFDEALRDTIQSMMEATPIHSGERSPRMLSDVLGHNNIDTALRNNLAAGDAPAVQSRFLELVNEARGRTGDLIAVDLPQPSGLIASDMVSVTAAQRAKYQSDAETFLQQAEAALRLVTQLLET
jgi:hypothetical protein